MNDDMELNRVCNEDCLEGMKRIPDGSVDCIICDLYLIGWIGNCLNDARLGIGDLVEIKDKEE